MDIILIRHTKVDTKEGVCYGQTDVGLAPSFAKEKKVIQKKLPHGSFDAIYASPLRRCKQLAESLFANKEILFDDRLKELNFGSWEGLHWDDISSSEEAEAFFNDYINTACPGGESYQDMLKRVTDFYDEIKGKYKKIVIVTHGGPIRALLCLLENISPKEAFKKKYEINLGMMSFFIRARVEALKEIPQINAFIDGQDIIEHHYYHIGVAIGSDRGLVVPVIRHADKLSFAGLEQAIVDYVKQIKANRLEISDLEGGTFTISNGGVYGSLLSTPILNVPQSAILGMHKIEKRPVVIDDEIVVRPMMYVALSYDHRIVDGREAVTFLKRIKECVENPERVLMEI